MSQKLFGWCFRAAYANFGGLFCYHRGNNLNPKPLLVQRSLKETGCDYSEGLRASISLKDWRSLNSLLLLPPPCQLFLAFFYPPKYTSHPKTLPNAEKYSILRIFISLYFISHVSHDFSLGYLKCPTFKGERWGEARGGPREFSGPTELCCCSVFKLAASLQAALSEPAGNRWSDIKPWTQSLPSAGPEKGGQAQTAHNPASAPGLWALIYCCISSMGDSGTRWACLENGRRSLWPEWSEWGKEWQEVRSQRYRGQIR